MPRYCGDSGFGRTIRSMRTGYFRKFEGFAEEVGGVQGVGLMGAYASGVVGMIVASSAGFCSVALPLAFSACTVAASSGVFGASSSMAFISDWPALLPQILRPCGVIEFLQHLRAGGARHDITE